MKKGVDNPFFLWYTIIKKGGRTNVLDGSGGADGGGCGSGGCGCSGGVCGHDGKL